MLRRCFGGNSSSVAWRGFLEPRNHSLGYGLLCLQVESDGDVHILHICPVELCDSGQVTCVARSGMSGGEECVARTELAVSDGDDRYDEVGQAAVLIRGPCDTTALRGDRVALKATYAGVPHPLVRWLKAVSTCLHWGTDKALDLYSEYLPGVRPSWQRVSVYSFSFSSRLLGKHFRTDQFLQAHSTHFVRYRS